LLGVVLLWELFQTFASKQFIASVFTGELFQDTVIGSAIGSIAAGNPITSYIIGGELMKEGVSLFAITAFIVTWVTVSIVLFFGRCYFSIFPSLFLRPGRCMYHSKSEWKHIYSYNSSIIACHPFYGAYRLSLATKNSDEIRWKGVWNKRMVPSYIHWNN
jgi:hypothetical protein